MRLRRRHAVSAAARAPGWRGGRALLGCALAAALVAGCTPIVHQQGHVSDSEALAEIKPGVQTRAEVARLLGTPSAVGTFDDARWYYISRHTETEAFNAPELVDQSVIVIAFDESGVVAEVTSVSTEEARAVVPIDEETATRGRELGLLEQLFGNIGRPAPRSQ